MSTDSVIKQWLHKDFEWAYEGVRSSAELQTTPRVKWAEWPPCLPLGLIGSGEHNICDLFVNGRLVEDQQAYLIMDETDQGWVLKDLKSASYVTLRIRSRSGIRYVVAYIYPKFELTEDDIMEVFHVWYEYHFNRRVQKY